MLSLYSHRLQGFRLLQLHNRSVDHLLIARLLDKTLRHFLCLLASLLLRCEVKLYQYERDGTRAPSNIQLKCYVTVEKYIREHVLILWVCPSEPLEGNTNKIIKPLLFPDEAIQCFHCDIFTICVILCDCCPLRRQGCSSALALAEKDLWDLLCGSVFVILKVHSTLIYKYCFFTF